MLEFFNEFTSLLCYTGHFTDRFSWATLQFLMLESFANIGTLGSGHWTPCLRIMTGVTTY